MKQIVTTSRFHDREEGAVAVLVAVGLLLLMGFSALAIDGGMGYSDRRGTQNAADNAALAAAWEDCNPATAVTTPQAAAIATAAENGYDNDEDTVDVVVNDLGAGQWQVDIRTSNDGAFSAATPYADDNITVLSSAIAECEAIPYLGGYAVFAGGPATCNGGVELDLSGASKIVNGGIHSNGELKITGSSTDINGEVTYIADANGYTPSTQLFSELDYPVEISIAEYRPGGSRASAYDTADPLTDQYFNTTDIDNNWLKNNGYAVSTGGTSIEMIKSGVYYASNGIDIKQVSMAAGVKATFVAEGQIKLTGESDFAGFDPVVGGANDPGLLFFSNYEAPPSGPTCTGNAIDVSTSNVTWTGVIFAPYGAVTPSFSSATSLNGSIFAYTVNVSGSDFEISWHDNEDAIPDFRVNLLE